MAERKVFIVVVMIDYHIRVEFRVCLINAWHVDCKKFI